MIIPVTYLDDCSAAMDLEPSGRLQLLFDAWLSHGPGHDENLSFLIGPDNEATHDVLWLESDMADQLSALAWLPQGTRFGIDLFRLLLSRYWQREKEEHDLEDPIFYETMDNPEAALSSEEIHELIKQVWRPS